ncbi:MAG TPA: GntP family permease, partial [Plasticicumulans sp.]|nr:GntP family permease [Plasticicumulans sp.]
WSVLGLAPIAALVAAAFSGEPLLAHWTQTFMGSAAGFVAQFFPLFLLGALFGKLMDDSGSVSAIARFMTDKLGPSRSVLAVVLAGALVTYGGVSLFVAMFVIAPMGQALFRAADIPNRLLPAAVMLGTATFTMSALPGTPAIQNAIPMPFFGTNTFAAPGLGIIAGVFMFAFGQFWLNRRVAQARARGEGYGNHEDALSQAAEQGMPPFWLALLPIVVVIVLNYIATSYVIPAMDTAYLATDKFKKTPLSAVLGIWSIILAMLVAITLVAVLNRKRIANLLDTFNKGTMGSLLPMANVASEVAYGAVIASLAAFAIVREGLKSVASDPVTSLFIVVTVLAGMTGSASGGMSLALGAMGEYYAHAAQAAGINPEIMHRIAALGSAAMDILPHNGAVITLLAICSLTHRESYLDLFMVGSLSALLSSVLVLGLNAVFGTF